MGRNRRRYIACNWVIAASVILAGCFGGNSSTDTSGSALDPDESETDSTTSEEEEDVRGGGLVVVQEGDTLGALIRSECGATTRVLEFHNHGINRSRVQDDGSTYVDVDAIDVKWMLRIECEIPPVTPPPSDDEVEQVPAAPNPPTPPSNSLVIGPEPETNFEDVPCESSLGTSSSPATRGRPDTDLIHVEQGHPLIVRGLDQDSLRLSTPGIEPIVLGRNEDLFELQISYKHTVGTYDLLGDSGQVVGEVLISASAAPVAVPLEGAAGSSRWVLYGLSETASIQVRTRVGCSDLVDWDQLQTLDHTNGVAFLSIDNSDAPDRSFSIWVEGSNRSLIDL